MNKDKKIGHSKSCYDLTPEEIYNIVVGKDKGGIEGYCCPKKYFDYRQCVWFKRRKEILDRHKAIWPPDNWETDKQTDKKIPPKRNDFIDDQIKWANSFNDPKKAQEVKEALESKGKKITEPHPFKSDFEKKINKKNLGKDFKEREEELKKIRQQINSVPEYKQNAIDQVNDKIKNDEYKPHEKKSNWSKNIRVMYNADNEYLGEQNPFWNPNTKEEDKKKAEFFPNKIRFMRRNPSWLIGPKKGLSSEGDKASEYIKARDERLEEKAHGVLEKMGVDRKTYVQDPVNSYHLIHKHGQLPLLFRKVYDYANTEQYKLAKEKSSETPAPNTYWDDGKSRVKIRKNIDDDQAKKYVMPREKTLKRLYVSGMRKSIY